jgi:hypothetical protein
LVTPEFLFSTPDFSPLSLVADEGEAAGAGSFTVVCANEFEAIIKNIVKKNFAIKLFKEFLKFYFSTESINSSISA